MKIGALLGNGQYAHALYDSLHNSNEVSARIYALLPPGLSDFSPHEVDGYIDLAGRHRFFTQLKEDGITSLVFGGRFNPRNLLHSAPFSRASMTLAWAYLRYGSFSGMLEALNSELDEYGIRLLHVGNLLPCFCLSRGEATGCALTRQDSELVDRHVEMAVDILGDQPARAVRQSLVFEDGELLSKETWRGTDALLKSIRARACVSRTRVLVKISTDHFDHRFDSPVIGPRTVTNAARAGICMILFEARKGIVMEKHKVIGMCRSAGIKLVGVTPDLSEN